MSKEDYKRLLDQLKLDLQRKFTKDQLASLLAGYMVGTEMFVNDRGFPQGLKEVHENAKNLVGAGPAELVPDQEEPH